MAKVEAGLAAFVSDNQESGKQSQEIYEAIELLTSLGEFDQFKTLMLEKKGSKN